MRQPQATLVGILSAGVTSGLVEALGHLLAPQPFPVEMGRPDAMQQMMADAPLLALAFVPAAWFLGSALGAYVSVRLANLKPARPGWITGGLFLLLALQQLRAFPHPLWMWLAGLAAIAAGTWLGTRQARDTPADGIPPR